MKTRISILFILIQVGWMAGDEIGVGLNVEIDNNLFKFLVSELKDDIKQILLK